MEVSRISSKDQVTIPKSVRERLKLNEGDKVAFIEESGMSDTTNNAMRESNENELNLLLHDT